MNVFFHVDRLNVLDKLPSVVRGQLLLTDYFDPRDENQAYLDELFARKFSQHGLNYIRQPPVFTNNNETHTDGALELVFELGRRLYYPDKPSRYQSLFAVETSKDAIDFRMEFSKPNPQAAIWKVTGKSFFRADMALLKFGHSPSETLKNIHKYWTGESSNNPRWEIILSFPIHIFEKYNEVENG